jgi:N-formylglutamate amidohydrolase
MSFTLHPGTTPLLISMPHVGTAIPDDRRLYYQPRALQVEDTDWYLDRLYAFAADLGASLLIPNESRYLTPSCARRATSPANRCTARARSPMRSRCSAASICIGSRTTMRWRARSSA